MGKLIISGYGRRMKVYLEEMFPILPRFIYATLLVVSLDLFLIEAHGQERSIISLHNLVGVLGIFSLLLILRLMDELKDREIDRELFGDRPLPSGRVLQSDIWWSLGVTIAFYLFVNILVRSTFWMALFVLAYSLLMFRYFFIPNILRRYLLLNLATHNPIIPIMLLYLVVLFATAHQLNLHQLNWGVILPLILMYWLVSFAWEISRKIRSLEEENAYVTYSQILGRVGAVGVVAGAQSLAFALGILFWVRFDLSGVFLALMATGYGLTMIGHARFLRNPNPVTSKLRPFSERYALVVIMANAIEYGLMQ